jgi:preprotein translocase subunit SecE
VQQSAARRRPDTHGSELRELRYKFARYAVDAELSRWSWPYRKQVANTFLSYQETRP